MPTNPLPTKLSPTQAATLASMATGDGVSLTPGGYRTAGRDAARWWATMRCLSDKGLVSKSGPNTYNITALGRQWVGLNWPQD